MRPVASWISYASTVLWSTGRISTLCTRPSTVDRRPLVSETMGLTRRDDTEPQGSSAALDAGLPAGGEAAWLPGGGAWVAGVSWPLRSLSASSLLCTSNGTIVAAACGIRLTAAATLSAVWSCNSRPSSGVKLRLGKTTVTPTPGSAASSLTSAAAALASRRSGQSTRSSVTPLLARTQSRRSALARCLSMTKCTARREVGGSVVSAHEGSGHDPYESVGLVAAVLILLLVFGSFLVMGLPLLSALIG